MAIVDENTEVNISNDIDRLEFKNKSIPSQCVFSAGASFVRLSTHDKLVRQRYITFFGVKA